MGNVVDCKFRKNDGRKRSGGRPPGSPNKTTQILKGRTARTFRLWQDKEAIASGTLWEAEIKNAAAQSVFFIPIITPTVVASPYCRFELDAFLAREAALGRSREPQWQHAVFSMIASLHYDWPAT